jgi:hypothetical protein
MEIIIEWDENGTAFIHNNTPSVEAGVQLSACLEDWTDFVEGKFNSSTGVLQIVPGTCDFFLGVEEKCSTAKNGCENLRALVQ